MINYAVVLPLWHNIPDKKYQVNIADDKKPTAFFAAHAHEHKTNTAVSFKALVAEWRSKCRHFNDKAYHDITMPIAQDFGNKL